MGNNTFRGSCFRHSCEGRKKKRKEKGKIFFLTNRPPTLLPSCPKPLKRGGKKGQRNNRRNIKEKGEARESEFLDHYLGEEGGKKKA